MSPNNFFDLGKIFEQVAGDLEKIGVSVEVGDDSACFSGEAGDSKVKVVCVTPGLKSSVDEMGKKPREHVVMVRVDAETRDALDAWVETGAVKSRSEAAALFIREGLRVRKEELDRLRDAIGDVEKARERLRREAREVFGSEGDSKEERE